MATVFPIHSHVVPIGNRATRSDSAEARRACHSRGHGRSPIRAISRSSCCRRLTAFRHPRSAARTEAPTRSRAKIYGSPSRAASKAASSRGRTGGKIGTTRYGLPCPAVLDDGTRSQFSALFTQSQVTENGLLGTRRPCSGPLPRVASIPSRASRQSVAPRFPRGHKPAGRLDIAASGRP